MSALTARPRIHASSFGTVLHFPRSLRLAADDAPTALLRKVRISALAAGCTRDQAIDVAAHAQSLMDKGVEQARIVPAAQSYARQLLTHDRGPTVPGAA